MPLVDVASSNSCPNVSQQRISISHCRIRSSDREEQIDLILDLLIDLWQRHRLPRERVLALTRVSRELCATVLCFPPSDRLDFRLNPLFVTSSLISISLTILIRTNRTGKTLLTLVSIELISSFLGNLLIRPNGHVAEFE